ncbi:MAG: hypothetical protein F6K24_12395 [Okeania sp. SIO2D1]|nr:hypothetical protein [Okeania sp. SIO2D1]
MEIQQAEMEVDFKFEEEGNLYITKAKAGANFKVKLVWKPKQSENE